MKILLLGSNGQIGYELQRSLLPLGQVKICDRNILDFEKLKDLRRFVLNYRPNIIVNAAAYTAVDKAEVEIELADQVNHIAVKQLAKIAEKQKAKLIHISTDYVFDGESNKPYRETDVTHPLNIYGKTKLAGEQAIQAIMQTDAIIIRTSWIYSEYGNNFVDTILRLGKERDELNIVNDQIGSPTFATNIAETILDLIQNQVSSNSNQETQIYHFGVEC